MLVFRAAIDTSRMTTMTEAKTVAFRAIWEKFWEEKQLYHHIVTEPAVSPRARTANILSLVEKLSVSTLYWGFQNDGYYRQQVVSLEEQHRKRQDPEDITALFEVTCKYFPWLYCVSDENCDLANLLNNEKHSASLKKRVLFFVFETTQQHR